MKRRLAIGLVMLVGCGDDGGSTTSSAPPPAARPAPAKPTARGKKGVNALKDYPKVEDRVTEIERPTIRHVFRETDFQSDPSGLESRDPFRSYVVVQTGLDTGLGKENAVPATQLCETNQLVAANFSLRDLRLVGIVTRGVRKFALFQDPSDYGHIINRNDCVGREKAKVKDIGAGFVTLTITPPTPANAAPRPPEERSVPLYPEELKLGETDRDRGRDPGLAPPTLPATGPDPVLPEAVPPPSDPAPTP